MKIESFRKVMGEPQESWPTREDFINDRVFIDNILVQKVKGKLKQRRCLVRGAEGRGKTVLARVIAYDYSEKEKWQVRFLDVRESGGVSSEIESIKKQIIRANSPNTLFIVENAQASMEAARELRLLADNEEMKCFFIFTLRRIFSEQMELSIEENPFESWEEKEWYVDLEPNIETAIEVTKKFMSSHNIGYSLSPEDTSWMETVFGEEKLNLRRLHWHLKAWAKERDKSGTALKDVPIESVLKEVLGYYTQQLSGDIFAQEMLFKIAAIFQFDVPFYYGNYLNTPGLKGLFDKRIILLLKGNFCRLQHSTDVAAITEATAVLREENTTPEAYTLKTLYEYICSRPKNYCNLLKALFQNRKNNILTHIFGNDNTYTTILDLIKNNGFKEVGSILFYLTGVLGKGEGLNLWCKYKKSLGNTPEEQKEKLRNKLRDAYLLEVVYLLLNLSKLDVSEKDWLVNEVLDETVLVEKAKQAGLSTIGSLLKFLPVEKASAVSSILDEVILAEKVKKTGLSAISQLLWRLPNEKTLAVVSEFNKFNQDEIRGIAQKPITSAQRLMWFLKYCSKSPNKSFITGFLKEIDNDEEKKKKLVEIIKNSRQLSTIAELRRIIRQINPNLGKYIKKAFLPNGAEMFQFSNLSGKFVKRLRWLSSTREEDAQLVIKELLSRDFKEAITKLYSNKESEPLVVLSKLLACVYCVFFQTEKDIYDTLCQKIVSELNLGMHIKIPFDKGLACLVWYIFRWNDQKGGELADKIFELDFDKLLEESESEAINWLLWNLLQIDSLKVTKWTQNVQKEKWLSKAAQSSSCDAFLLLWNLNHIDSEKMKSVARTLAGERLRKLEVLKTEDLPLLGLFRFCNNLLDLLVPLPLPYEIAKQLSDNLSIASLAFSLNLLREKDGDLLEEFSKELSRYLFLRGPALFTERIIEEMIREHPFETTKPLLKEMFEGFNLSKEPDSTFSEMISLTKTHLNNRGKSDVAFGELMKYFLANPPDNPIFKSEEDSRNWINTAIRYGVYKKQNVPHFKDPSKMDSLLSLNENTIYNMPPGSKTIIREKPFNNNK